MHEATNDESFGISSPTLPLTGQRRLQTPPPTSHERASGGSIAEGSREGIQLGCSYCEVGLWGDGAGAGKGAAMRGRQVDSEDAIGAYKAVVR